MTAIRLSGTRGLMEELVNPGDTIVTGEFVASNATVGSATIPAAQLVSGTLNRSGSTGAYTDTFDTAVNVITALTGNVPAGALVPGHSFRFRLYNSVAYAETITLGAGMVAGVGTVSSVSASTWRDFLFTVQNTTPSQNLVMNTTSGSPTATIVLPAGMVAMPIGVQPIAVNIQPGATAIGSGIPASTTVLGIVQGQGGITGVTLSANATATATNVAVNFGPTIKVDGLGSGTL